MSAEVVLKRLPTWVLVAVMSPTLLVGVVVAMHFLHVLPWILDPVMLALVWMFATLPVTLVALGLKQMDKRWRPGPDPGVEEALEALEDAAKTVHDVRQYLEEQGVIQGDEDKETESVDSPPQVAAPE